MNQIFFKITLNLTWKSNPSIYAEEKKKNQRTEQFYLMHVLFLFLSKLLITYPYFSTPLNTHILRKITRHDLAVPFFFKNSIIVSFSSSRLQYRFSSDPPRSLPMTILPSPLFTPSPIYAPYCASLHWRRHCCWGM